MRKKTKEERVIVVLEICRKLKQFPTTTGIVDLYNSYYGAILKIKDIFNQYINQDDSNPNELVSFSGEIPFPEIRMKIEYILPIKQYKQSLFVFRNLQNKN
jgi:hypothetical protein